MSSDRLGRAELLQALDQALRWGSAQGVLFSQAIAGRLGMNSTDVECLDILTLSGAITAGRLAELTGLTTGAITGVIDRLEGAGYVRRERDPHDRRRVIIQPLLEEVERRIAPLYDSLGQSIAVICSGYSDEELALILNFLSRAHHAVQEETARLHEATRKPKPAAEAERGNR